VTTADELSTSLLVRDAFSQKLKWSRVR